MHVLFILLHVLYSCTNEEQIKTVTETAKALENLSTELVACAKEIAATFETREEDHHLAIEKAEILRRDWAAKVSKFRTRNVI